MEADPLSPAAVLPHNVLPPVLGVEVTAEAELRPTVVALNIHQRDEYVETVSGEKIFYCKYRLIFIGITKIIFILRTEEL